MNLAFWHQLALKVNHQGSSRVIQIRSHIPSPPPLRNWPPRETVLRFPLPAHLSPLKIFEHFHIFFNLKTRKYSQVEIIVIHCFPSFDLKCVRKPLFWIVVCLTDVNFFSNAYQPRKLSPAPVPADLSWWGPVSYLCACWHVWRQFPGG